MEAVIQKLWANFNRGVSRPYEWRIKQLQGVRKFVNDNEKEIIDALREDMGRPKLESYGDVLPLLSELSHMESNLRQWMKPEQTAQPAASAPCDSQIYHEPHGVCLVVGAFNYPIILTLQPLLGAICGGNCAVIKPSELATATEKILLKLEEYVDSSCIQVVTGGIEVSKALLEQKWGYVFFTGSPRVGKIVAQASAKNLTPYTLELGGKSPTIVDETVTNLDLAAKRIIWGKCFNAGQTCIAPDYLFCHEKHYEELLASMKKYLVQFYGENAQTSKDFGRIINPMHAKRLENAIKKTVSSGAKVFYGGKAVVQDKYIEPTILTDLKPNSAIMEEEIFGPILPVFKYNNLDDVVQYINTNHENPLSMYIFSKDDSVVERLTSMVNSGSVVVNDFLFQFSNSFAPMGGVGNSGVGAYHGKYSFTTFTRPRAVLRKPLMKVFDPSEPFRYPPYSDFSITIFSIVFKLPGLPGISQRSLRSFKYLAIGGGIIAALWANGINDSRSFGMLLCKFFRTILGA